MSHDPGGHDPASEPLTRPRRAWEWWKDHWRKIGAIFAVLVVAYAVQTSAHAVNVANKATTQAAKSQHEAKEAALAAKRLTLELARVEHKRAIGSCASSTDLRSLLSDLKAYIFPNGPKNATDSKIIIRIDKFVATNPNCANLPPTTTPPSSP